MVILKKFYKYYGINWKTSLFKNKLSAKTAQILWQNLKYLGMFIHDFSLPDHLSDDNALSMYLNSCVPGSNHSLDNIINYY